MSYFVSASVSGRNYYWRYSKEGGGRIAFEYFKDPQQEFLRTHPTQAGRECRFNFRRVWRRDEESADDITPNMMFNISPVDTLNDFRVLRAEKGKLTSFIDRDMIDNRNQEETLFEAKAASASGAFVFKCVATGDYLALNQMKQLATVSFEDRATVFSLTTDLGNGAVIANRMPYNLRLGADDLFVNCEEGKAAELSSGPGDSGLFVFSPFKTLWRDKKNTFVLGLCCTSTHEPKLSLNLSLQREEGSTRYYFAAKRMFEMNAWDEFELLPVEGHLGRFFIVTAAPLPGTVDRLVLAVDRSRSTDNLNHALIVPLPLDKVSLADAFYAVPRQFPPSDDRGRDDLPPIGCGSLSAIQIPDEEEVMTDAKTLSLPVSVTSQSSKAKLRLIAACLLFGASLLAYLMSR